MSWLAVCDFILLLFLPFYMLTLPLIFKHPVSRWFTNEVDTYIFGLHSYFILWIVIWPTASVFENELDLVDKMCRTDLPLKGTPNHSWLSRRMKSWCFCIHLGLVNSAWSAAALGTDPAIHTGVGLCCILSVSLLIVMRHLAVKDVSELGGIQPLAGEAATITHIVRARARLLWLCDQPLSPVQS